MEDHRITRSANVQMDGPAVADPNATSTTSNRLFRRAMSFGDVSSTTVQMLGVASTADSAVRGRRPVPRHNGQRPISSTSDALEDLDESSVWPDELAGAMIAELARAEVR